MKRQRRTFSSSEHSSHMLSRVTRDRKQDQTDPLLGQLGVGLGETLDGADEPLGGHSDDDGREDEETDGEGQVASEASTRGNNKKSVEVRAAESRRGGDASKSELTAGGPPHLPPPPPGSRSSVSSPEGRGSGRAPSQSS